MTSSNKTGLGKEGIHILRILKKSGRFPKDVYSPRVRKAFSRRPEKVLSTVGKWDNGHLYISDRHGEELNPARLKAIILTDELTDWETRALREDAAPEQTAVCRSEIKGLNKETGAWQAEFFTFSLNESEGFDISLNYSEYALYIGEPERENYPIGILKKGQPLEILIKGKSDFSLSGRRQRTYAEFAFLMEYLGMADASGITHATLPQTAVDLPPKPRKKIDLRKRFY
jgi:hypothetical protein